MSVKTVYEADDRRHYATKEEAVAASIKHNVFMAVLQFSGIRTQSQYESYAEVEMLKKILDKWEEFRTYVDKAFEEST